VKAQLGQAQRELAHFSCSEMSTHPVSFSSGTMSEGELSELPPNMHTLSVAVAASTAPPLDDSLSVNFMMEVELDSSFGAPHASGAPESDDVPLPLERPGGNDVIMAASSTTTELQLQSNVEAASSSVSVPFSSLTTLSSPPQLMPIRDDATGSLRLSSSPTALSMLVEPVRPGPDDRPMALASTVIDTATATSSLTAQAEDALHLDRQARTSLVLQLNTGTGTAALMGAATATGSTFHTKGIINNNGSRDCKGARRRIRAE
jgi:hypothetical protein